MPFFLFLKPLAQRLHKFVKTTRGFDLGFFFRGQMLFSHLFQPFMRDIHRLHHLVEADVFKTREGCRKGAVELVDVAFVFDHAGARKIVERVYVIGRKPGRHTIEKRQKLAHGHRHLMLAQLLKERQKHILRSG